MYYTYGDSNWGDLLTSYDGQTLTYDNIGNLTNDGTWTYTWEHGRQLAQMSQSGTTWSFEYDASGLRTKRTNGSTTYEYFYTGDQLTMMTYNGSKIWFYYDASGTPYALYYNGAYYYYATNLQGDVMAILNTSGTAVVQYTYDAWGNIRTRTGSMSSTLGQYNPLRYRGYVYDAETGLYYLQSRYYNPEVGRFINADTFVSTSQGLLGNNMFAYCRNNPVRRRDVSGMRDDECVEDANEDDNPLNDLGGPTGGGGGSAPGVKSSYYTAQRVHKYDWSWQNSSYNQSSTTNSDVLVQNSSAETSKALLPKEYWTNKKAPQQSTPNSSYTNVKYNDHTGNWEYSTAYYDIGGRQFMRIDWTNHGYSNHGNPHIHYKIFDAGYPMGIKVRID